MRLLESALPVLLLPSVWSTQLALQSWACLPLAQAALLSMAAAALVMVAVEAGSTMVAAIAYASSNALDPPPSNAPRDSGCLKPDVIQLKRELPGHPSGGRRVPPGAREKPAQLAKSRPSRLEPT